MKRFAIAGLVGLFMIGAVAVFADALLCKDAPNRPVENLKILMVKREANGVFAVVEKTPGFAEQLAAAGVQARPDPTNSNQFWVANVIAVMFSEDTSPEGMAQEALESKVKRARSDMRTLAVALEAYYVDNNRYPPSTDNPALSARKTPPGKPTVPSFRMKQPGEKLMSLTTPIAYIVKLPEDPFAEIPEQTYGYYLTPNGLGWILFSAGPDGTMDLGWKTYDSSKAQPSIELIGRYTYDPTNGSVSAGDLYRVKQ